MRRLARSLASPALGVRRCSAAAAPAEAQTLLDELLRGAEPLPAEAAAATAGLLRSFVLSQWVAEQAAAHSIPPSLLPEAAQALRRTLLAGCPPSVLQALAPPPADAGSAAKEAAARRLFPLFAAFTKERFGARVEQAAPLLLAADLSGGLLTAFPAARALGRRLVYHHGPTNSGKTHAALAALRAAPSGLYCGPLRLLAQEVYHTLNCDGVLCNLRTGQELRAVPGARHSSCTVEVAETGEAAAVDVAVLDEIQLLADEQRGWAWTRALYGLPARELHLCGDASALPLVRHAAAALGEQLEERAYERLTPLRPQSRSLGGDTGAVRPGDALVAFSRRDIFALKAAVERGTGRRCAVVYGALPPEARRRQAQLFNEAAPGGHEVLIASDAIGLGLNLNIRRVVFSTLSRREGAAGGGGGRGGAQPARPPTPLPPALVRQIAGRAGRAASRWGADGGLVAALHDQDVPYMLQCLAAPTAEAPAAGLAPQWDNIAPFADAHPGDTLPQLLRRASEAARLGGRFFLCRSDDLVAAAELLERVPGLSLGQRFLFATAPISSRSPAAAAALLALAAAYASGEPVRLGALGAGEAARGGARRAASAAAEALGALEARHAHLGLYLWLARRLGGGEGEEAFPDAAAAEAASQRCVAELEEELARGSDAALRDFRGGGRRRGGFRG